jgi:dinuclear metal center YbgI/SA1388 family protein
MIIQHVCQFLESYAPLRLAEDWDNVGLIVGDRQSDVNRIMTCLTVTPETVTEAIAENAQLIVSHHPLPFRPIKKLTTDSVSSAMLWKLARAGVSVYSPHTAFDSTVGGINELLAEKLNVGELKPLVVSENDTSGAGAGRYGRLGASVQLGDWLNAVKQEFGLPSLAVVGDLDQVVSKIAFACGSGGSFLDKAIRVGCDVMVTGEATFHTCLDAKAKSLALVLLGHYASERFAVESLADRLQREFSELRVWASRQECCPVLRI